MNWFSGELSEGIKQVKSEKKFLLVFCKDENDPSADGIPSILDNESVCIYCKDMICLLIQSNAESYKQFSSIYNVPCLPCIHIILPSGVVFAVRTSEFSLAGLSSWLKDAQSEYLKTKTPVFEHASEKMDNSSASTSQNLESPQPRKLTVEEKIEHARKILEAKHDEELQKEFEKTHSSEVERRRLGKGLTDFKQRQHEEAVREQVEERKRAKADDKVARERVLRQIEIDRQDRERLSSPMPDTLPTKLKSDQTSPISTSKTVDRNLIRLQIRLPDGANFSSIFPSTATLADDVRRCIENRISGSDENDISLNDSVRSSFQRAVESGFTFRQLRPARRFTSEDEFLPLIELDLWPSSVLVLCTSSGSQFSSGNQLFTYSQGAFGQVIFLVGSGIRFGTDLFYSLGNNVISYTRRLYEYLTRGAGSDGSVQTPTTARSSMVTPRETSAVHRNGESNAYRRHGNISRLSHMPDDTDEQARWNGNSTTQL